jgi:carbonic anhydrase
MKLLSSVFATSLVFSSIFTSSQSSAAQSPRMKDEVAKIAVGPKTAPTEKVEAPEPESSNEASPDEAADFVDKPVRRATITTTDAPKETPKETPEEASETSTKADLRDAEAAEAADNKAFRKGEEATQKIDISKPKAPKAQNMKIENAAPVKAHAEKRAEAVLAPIAVSEKPGHVVDGVSAEQSLKWLANGNSRYATKKFRADGRSDKERAKTAKEQKPHAIVLSCSDSRVPPEIIFDQGLGEITAIRVAGEVVDSSVIASVEQTLMNDHPHLLVVLGHTQCESLEAAFSWKEKATYGSDALDRLVAEIKPHMKTLSSTGARSPGLQVEAALQADGVGRDLIERSELIKKAVESGELTIKTGLYWVDTGKVKFY